MTEKNMLSVMPKLTNILRQWAKFGLAGADYEKMSDASLSLKSRQEVMNGLKKYAEEHPAVSACLAAIRICQLDDVMHEQRRLEAQNESDDDFDLADYPS